MLSQTETRKYQLFPQENQAISSQGKGLDPEQAFAFAMAQNGDKIDKPYMGGLRIRMRDHNLLRRRKVSVPELGPMTTVYESMIDSPTLPGRPACHERSISAPGNDLGQNHETNFNMCPAGISATSKRSEINSGQPRSPKDLPPLLIPVQTSSRPRATRQRSQSRLRSGSASSSELNLRAARTDGSPKTRAPCTLLLASQTASTSPSVTTQCKPEVSTTVLQTCTEHPTDCVQNTTTPKSAVEAGSTFSTNYHRRNLSESSSITGSIMDRGRPRKKNEAYSITTKSKSKSAERRAFETLPKGWKATESVHMLDQPEIAAIRKQAVRQAERFEVMRKEDVDNLSRELRNLDERAEYLRRTYHSLRAGRRNLHSRICQYLRSPRVAQFNHEPVLKQEEALAELDASIDDWVTKLEQVENRRIRIRQKLLEHVAAAVTLPVSNIVGVSESLHIAMGIARPSVPANLSTPPRSPIKISSTPRTRSSSPALQRVIAQIPSTVLNQPIVEEAAAFGPGVNHPAEQQGTAGEKNKEVEEPLSSTGTRRATVESIRIYAGDEIAAFLGDVEQQMVRMGRSTDHDVVLQENNSNMSDKDHKELHRAHIIEVLQGGLQPVPSDTNIDKPANIPNTTIPSSSTCTSRTATPITPEPEEQAPGEFLLTNAVFNPKTAVSQ